MVYCVNSSFLGYFVKPLSAFASFSADLCQIYRRPTEGTKGQQSLAEPFRDSASPSNQQWRGDLGPTQDHHPSS